MKFRITRTSLWSTQKPCEEAVKEKFTRVEIRGFKSFEEFDKKFGKTEGGEI